MLQNNRIRRKLFFRTLIDFPTILVPVSIQKTTYYVNDVDVTLLTVRVFGIRVFIYEYVGKDIPDGGADGGIQQILDDIQRKMEEGEE